MNKTCYRDATNGKDDTNMEIITNLSFQQVVVYPKNGDDRNYTQVNYNRLILNNYYNIS